MTSLENEIYQDIQTYNDLVVQESRREKQFSDFEKYLIENKGDIEQYKLKPDILKLIQNNNISINKVSELIGKRREEEAELEKERKRKEEAERRRQREAERQRRKKEEQERLRREELERQQREAAERERKRKLNILKWIGIAIAAIIAIILVWKLVEWLIESKVWIILLIIVIVVIVIKIVKDR